MNLLKKIIAGDDVRPTRFHDAAGIFLQLNELPKVINSLSTYTTSRFSKEWPHLPWWVWGQ